MKQWIAIVFIGFFGAGYTQGTIEELKIKNEELTKEINKLKIEKEQKVSEIQKELESLKNKLVEEQKNLKEHLFDQEKLDKEINDYNISLEQVSAHNILKNKTILISTESSNNKLESFKSKLIKSGKINASTILIITKYNASFKLTTSNTSAYSYEDKYTDGWRNGLKTLSLDEKETKLLNKLIDKGSLVPASDMKKELKKITEIDDEYLKLKDEKEKLGSKIVSVKTSKRKTQNELDKLETLKSNTEDQITDLENKIESITKEQKHQEKIKEFNKTVKKTKIGTQVWMTENLDVSTFSNGDLILQTKTVNEWAGLNSLGDVYERPPDDRNFEPAWCYYNNDPAYGEKYGKLYNWYAAADPRGLCPAGWHVPSKEEWHVLGEFLGGGEEPSYAVVSFEGASAKMRTKEGWGRYGNHYNESGFAGLPGGHCSWDGEFYGTFDPESHMFWTKWWSSTDYHEGRYGKYGGSVGSSAYYATLLEEDFRLINNSPMDNGLSVRCIQDEIITIDNENISYMDHPINSSIDTNRYQELSGRNFPYKRKAEIEVSTVKIGGLEVMTEDLGEMIIRGRGNMYGGDALRACGDLGNGWRLPTKDECFFLFSNEKEIGEFGCWSYWTSTHYEGQGMGSVTKSQKFMHGGDRNGVRCVREDLQYLKLSSTVKVAEREVSTVKIGGLEVMTEDLGRMTWDDALRACGDLGNGWRLPTKEELHLLYSNKKEIGGFIGFSYWSSAELDVNSAWRHYFPTGFQGNSNKNLKYFVRAVRSK